jgi:hypothetical protein
MIFPTAFSVDPQTARLAASVKMVIISMMMMNVLLALQKLVFLVLVPQCVLSVKKATPYQQVLIKADVSSAFPLVPPVLAHNHTVHLASKTTPGQTGNAKVTSM